MPKQHHNRRPSGWGALADFLLGNKLNWLLLLVLVSIAVDLLALPDLWLFISAALAIVPLARVIGEATGQVADHVGSVYGGILSAAFSNVPELIIGIFALNAGLITVVKASISGSIIVNILVALGLAMLVGGWRRDRQTFSVTTARTGATLLFVAAAALVMPAIFDLTVFGTLYYSTAVTEAFSVLVATVLFATFLASVVFTIRTRRRQPILPVQRVDKARLPLWQAILILIVATATVAYEAQLLVSSLTGAISALGISEFFVGLVVVPLISNVAEIYAASLMAARNRIGLSVVLAAGAAIQMALFVAPLLVFVSLIFAQPLLLLFELLEIAGIVLAVLTLALVSGDGESNWLEGVELLALYLVLAIIFYFVPGAGV